MSQSPAPSSFSGASRAGSAVVSRRFRRALGRKVRSHNKAAARSLRFARFASKNVGSSLLKGHDDKLAYRLSACCEVAHGDSVDLVAQSRANGDITAVFRGLVTCKSVWSCAVCSARISALRKDELNHLISWARIEGYSVVMLTLTARHSRATVLRDFMAAMSSASARLRSSRGWRALNLVGAVSALEVTHGNNGWHVHSHLVLISPLSSAAAVSAVDALRPEWLRCLGKSGLSGNHAALHVADGSAAGDYVGKFGAAEELALGHVKQGRGGSRTPWQLLADAAAGDRRAASLWVEFSLAFKGKRQLVWSRGLKALCGLKEVSDADAPDDLAPQNEIVSETVLRSWQGNGDAWRSAARRRCALLDAVETGGCLDLAEFGTTDAMRWRAELLACQVIE